MAFVTRNLTDSLVLLDDFNHILSPERYVENIEDELTISDIFGSLFTARHIKNINDNLALTDIFTAIVNFSQTRNFEDTIFITDLFNAILRIAPIISIEDTIIILDTVSSEQSNRITKTINEAIILLDTFSKIQTVREVANPGDTYLIADTVVIQTGINVINGTGSGPYSVGDIVQLGAITPENKVFFRWVFNKSGIDNIYDPNATVTIPVNGGVITGEYLDLFESEDESVIIVVDPFAFEYVMNSGDDEILTNQTAKTVSMKMGVAQNNIEIPQGSRFANVIIYKDSDGNPVDLTGYTAEMQIRPYKSSTDDPILTLNTSNGYLTLGGTAGTITIAVPGNITEAFDFNWGRYDLELYPGGVVANSIRILEGKVHLNKEVTR